MYLDPPFNSNRTYEAPIGSEAAGAAFKDAWTLNDVDVQEYGLLADTQPALYRVIDAARACHSKGMMSYLIMMASRVLELKRVLKPTGSLYLHCDPTASHYLKAIMDAIFGYKNFVNEIIWCYKSGGASPNRKFSSKHDILLFYSMSSKYTYNVQTEKSYNRDFKPYRFKGIKEYQDNTGWYTLVGMKDYWNIDMVGRTSSERTGYPTQKPLALLERIIKASSNENDIVLDPFCGCATTCIAAEKLGRHWIGIDLSSKAVELVKLRARKELGLFSLDMVQRTDIPTRTDQGPVPPYKEQKHTLFGQQEGLCNGCKISFPFRNFTVDHVVPQSKGGTDHLENLQLLCGACNSLKGNRSQAYLLDRLQNLS